MKAKIFFLLLLITAMLTACNQSVSDSIASTTVSTSTTDTNFTESVTDIVQDFVGSEEIQGVSFTDKKLTIDFSEQVLQREDFDEILNNITNEVVNIAPQSYVAIGLNFQIESERLSKYTSPDIELSEIITPIETQAVGTKRILLNAGHGWFQKDNGNWEYQRPTPPNGVYAQEDIVTAKVAIQTNNRLGSYDVDTYSTRNLNVNAGTGVSGKAKWEESARHYLQSINAPINVWDSCDSRSCNPLDGDYNWGKDLRARPYYAEYIGADVMVSLHSNADGGSGTTRGTRVYFSDTNAYRQESEKLANIFATTISSKIQAERPDLEWKIGAVFGSGDHGENNFAKQPSVIIELAFHDNVIDGTALNDASFQALLGEAVKDGIVDYMNLNTATPPPPAPLDIDFIPAVLSALL